MPRNFSFLIVISLFFVFCCSKINVLGQQTTQVKTPGITSTNFIELDRERVIASCQPGAKSISSECGDTIVKVKNIYFNRKGKVIPLRYEVSGGKIIGEGDIVEWDLSKTRPGTYLITAFELKKGSYKKVVSKTIDLKECADCGCGLCDCAHINIILVENKPLIGTISPLKAGDEIDLIANVTGGSKEPTNYKWIVIGGKIIEGQETSQIKVQIDSDAKQITATVEIQALCADCPNSASTTIEIKDK